MQRGFGEPFPAIGKFYAVHPPIEEASKVAARGSSFCRPKLASQNDLHFFLCRNTWWYTPQSTETKAWPEPRVRLVRFLKYLADNCTRSLQIVAQNPRKSHQTYSIDFSIKTASISSLLSPYIRFTYFKTSASPIYRYVLILCQLV